MKIMPCPLNGAMISGVRPVAINSAIRLPQTGVALNPQVHQPASI